MTTFSSPIVLVNAGVINPNAQGLQWEGGSGTLYVSGVGAGPIAFQCTIDGGATWIPIQCAANGTLFTAIAADGAYLFQLGQCRVRISGTVGTGNVSAART